MRFFDLLIISAIYSFVVSTSDQPWANDLADPAVQNSSSDQTDVVSHSTTPRASLPALQLKIVSFHRIGHHPGYTVDVRYPKFVGAPKSTVRILNRRMRKLIDTHIPADSNPAMPNEYSCEFDKHVITPNFLSIALAFGYDWHGAHNGVEVVTFNYLLAARPRVLQLQDILRAPINYRRLAKLVSAKLQADQLQIAAADLDKSAFRNFVIDKSGITFVLPAGTFAAYASGCPTETIPYSKLQNMLSPNSPVYEIAQTAIHEERKKASRHSTRRRAQSRTRG